MHEEITFLTKRIVRKRASNGKQKLIDEINWLRSLPIEIRDHFPKVLESYADETNAYYTMPFYNIPTLRQALFKKVINGGKACDILDVIFNFMYKNFYSKNHKSTPSDFIKKIHFDRVIQRIELVEQKVQVFNKIISKTHILWNGERFLNALSLIGRFESEKRLITLLSPPWISQIHGDLHFDNILIDTDDLNNLSNFILIDPRGWPEGSDYVYDLGKLWHSFNGLYDFLHRGDFSLSYEEISETELKVDLKYKNSNILKEYKHILERLPKLLDGKYNLRDADPYWNFRTLFTEAMHFLSLPDFHLKFDGKEKKAISLYVIGVKLLNKVWNDYNSQLK